MTPTIEDGLKRAVELSEAFKAGYYNTPPRPPWKWHLDTIGLAVLLLAGGLAVELYQRPELPPIVGAGTFATQVCDGNVAHVGYPCWPEYGPQQKALNEAIAAAEDGAVITVPSGTTETYRGIHAQGSGNVAIYSNTMTLATEADHNDAAPLRVTSSGALWVTCDGCSGSGVEWPR